MESRAKKPNKRRNPLLLLFLTAVLLISLIGGVAAKYLVTTQKDGVVSSAAFYFESNLLSEEGKTYTLNAGTESVSFQVRNYADELRISETEIAYTVTASGCTVENGSGTLSGDEKDGETVVLKGLTNGGTYVVEVKGTGGYSKTLTATFVVRSVDTGFYKYLEKDGQSVALTVWLINRAGTVQITLPEGLLPDRRDPALEGVTGNTFTVELGSNHSVRYLFFIDETAYDDGEITVKIGDENAVLGVPA